MDACAPVRDQWQHRVSQCYVCPHGRILVSFPFMGKKGIAAKSKRRSHAAADSSSTSLDHQGSLTDDEKVLRHLRSLPELEIHEKVVIPLLQQMGLRNVRYIHGSFERGKDFVYNSTSTFGTSQLEVCQVKNEPFSGRATSSGATIGTLNQLQQCLKTEVLNPETHRLQLPNRVCLLTTYPVPDKDVAGQRGFLEELQSLGCEIVRPEALVQLLRVHLPGFYSEAVAPSTGLVRALRQYLNIHHEAHAFDLEERLTLDSFFINLGLKYDCSKMDVSRGKKRLLTWDVKIDLPRDQYNALIAQQQMLPAPLANLPVLLLSEEDPAEEGDEFDEDMLISHQDLDRWTTLPLKRITLDHFVVELRKYLDRLLSSEDDTHGVSALRLSVVFAAGVFLENTLLLLSTTDPELVVDVDASESSEVALNEDELRLGIDSAPPSSLIELRENIAIVGDAGAGKTSTARILAKSLLERGINCVYFPCIRIRDAKPTLADDILSFIREISPGTSRDQAVRYLRTAKIIVLDGCDEAKSFGPDLGRAISALAFPKFLSVAVHGVTQGAFSIPINLDEAVRYEKRRRRLSLTRPLAQWEFEQLRRDNSDKPYAEAIDNLIVKQQQNPRCVVTTRDADFMKLPANFTKIRLMPFREDQLVEFFGRWFCEAPKIAAEIHAFLQRNPHIRAICRTPIVATILAALRENGYPFPHSRAELYESRFRLLLEKWDRVKGILHRNRVKSSDKLMLLSRLAAGMHLAHKREFSRVELFRLWRDRLARLYPVVTESDLLDELRNANTVIYPAGKDSFSLGHLSYQEFLAARAFAHGGDYRELVHHGFDPWWKEVFVFYASISGDVGPILRELQRRFGIKVGESVAVNEMLKEARFTRTVDVDAVTQAIEEDDDFDEDDESL